MTATADAAAYRAATEGVAFAERSDRVRIRMAGRAPEQALGGLVSGTLPAPLRPVDGAGLRSGRAEGSALLTPKGRMIAELRLLRAGPDPASGFLVDFPAACADAAAAHLARFVPPRLAGREDVTRDTAMVTVIGPDAPRALAAALSGAGGPSADVLAGSREGDLLYLEDEDGGSLHLVRSGEAAPSAFDVLGSEASVAAVVGRLRTAGAHPLDPATLEVLRVEAGRPAWGAELDEETIPIEAGIHPRVVDYRKGCFTGQEVLVRIRDRGHVNRELRRLRLGELPPPEPGTELFRPGEEKAVGRVTSAVRSPGAGETLGLGYVRREVEAPAELRLGAPDGPPLSVLGSESGRPAEAGSGG